MTTSRHLRKTGTDAQLVLPFGTAQLTKNGGGHNRFKIAPNEMPRPAVDFEKPGVSALRQVLFEAAREHYRLMLKELEKPIVKHVSLPSLSKWPAVEEWSWPPMHLRVELYKDFFKAIKLPKWQTKKLEILKWANYHRMALTKLAGLDDLLREGNLEEFFKRCQSERGQFALEKRPKQDRENGRTLLGPHWPNRTREFRALKKEWENGQTDGGQAI